MDQSLYNDIRTRMIADYNMKERSGWLRAGRCPQCDKKELYTKAEKPWTIRCGRENNCGFEADAKELFPDLFENFSKRYPATNTYPNATANAYMRESRGFDVAKIKGWFEQGSFYSSETKAGSPTVRFYLDNERKLYWERFIENVDKIGRKAHFSGSFGGKCWVPPGMDVKKNDTVWVAEGIFDAIALYLSGIKAIAPLTTTNYPSDFIKEHADKNIKYVWALDSDKAGKKFNKKYVKRMREEGIPTGCAQVPKKDKKLDWNDLHQKGQLTENRINYFLYLGNLLIAQNASEKALLMYQQTERNFFPFEFNKHLYWFNLDLEAFSKELREIEKDDTHLLSEKQARKEALKRTGLVSEIANCYPEFLYFQSNQVTDESWYYTRVSFRHSAPAVKNTFTGAQLSGSSEFKKRLLAIASGAMFTGTSKQLDTILKDRLYSLKTVQTIDYIGYSKEHTAYVFSNIAVRNGKVFDINEEDFFDMGNLSIKSLSRSSPLTINPNQDDYQKEWFTSLHASFGNKGVVVLAYWLGCLFAEQIRHQQKSWPFLEVVGEPGSGKTTLIEFLWKLVGRLDYEGFDPSKATAAGRARNFAQVSNLPVVLIEGDRDSDQKSRGFDWDEMKSLYNGRSVRSRGVANAGNDTYEPPFRASIMISQNSPVDASEAILQRICHVWFDKKSHTEKSRGHADKLGKWEIEKLSGFILKAIEKEKELTDIIVNKTPEYEKFLAACDGVKSVRIAFNHAQIMACVDALATLIDIDTNTLESVYNLIMEMAIERQQAISADHPIVSDFWETVEYIESLSAQGQGVNHSANDQIFAVNLKQFYQECQYRKLPTPDITELKKHLKNSKSKKFKDITTVNSIISEKSVKCWRFVVS